MSSNESANAASSFGVEADSMVKQVQTFGRDIKDRTGDFTHSAAAVVTAKAGHLTDSAKEMAADVGDKLRASVTEQKAFGADYVGNVASIIRRTASEFDGEIPQAGHYIRKAATQLDNVSESLRNQDVSEIVAQFQDFARKQPSAFLGAAVLVGFAAVRFLKSGTGTSSGATTASQTRTYDGASKAGM